MCPACCVPGGTGLVSRNDIVYNTFALKSRICFRKMYGCERNDKRRNMRSRTAAIAMALAICALCGGIARAYDFSADIVTKTKGKTMQGKIFLSGEKSRMEMQNMVVIGRLDKKVTWMLMPDRKMYMESEMKPGSIPVEKDPSQVSKELVGKDTVDGQAATKYKVTFTDSKGGQTSVYQWFLDKNGFPVKTAALDDSWSHEYRNIKEGAQPPDLFEIPEGYKKFSMPAIPGASPN